ncbi:DUF1127 domain-containing protein [uncultured Oceanisphaera sp.]|uniref:DUF1127 domain-containing protein n=1 Tax=uncultured Oceanisphaera sp. TaxID=353858 RepID=UPI002633645E|nr:DUF1127 domain-containing protein [uncultured Oceanisphaera sp.]
MNTATYQTQDLSHAGKKTTQAGLLATLGLWLQRTRTRRQLSELPAYLLKDIGLNESDRYQEISKPFWQQ